jgi:hypothetical protein
LISKPEIIQKQDEQQSSTDNNSVEVLDALASSDPIATAVRRQAPLEGYFDDLAAFEHSLDQVKNCASTSRECCEFHKKLDV